MQDIAQGLCSSPCVLAPGPEPFLSPEPSLSQSLELFPRKMESCAAAPCSSSQLAYHQEQTPRPSMCPRLALRHGWAIMDGQQRGCAGRCMPHAPT